MKIFNTLFLLMITQMQLLAQLDTSKLNQLFNNYNNHNKVMLSMCLSENGKIVYDKSIGYTDIEQKIKPSNNSMYHIGSITKMFTSVIIFQLIDEKKLMLNSKLSEFYPSIPNASKITISNLLNHRSGLFNFTSDTNFSTYMETAMSEVALLSIFEKYKPDFEPNTKSEYSNTNYVLLSFIIEKITKNKYENELQKRICSKISLKNTKVATNDEKDKVLSYEFENNKWELSTSTHMSIPRGAGAIISTPSDLCKFIEALFDHKLMSDSSFNQMKLIEDDHGRGIFKMPFGKKIGFGHTGSIDGFHSTLGYFPEDKMAFCILGNAWNYPMNDVAIAVLSIYYNKPFIIPSFEQKEMTEADRKLISGKYANSKISMNINIKKDKDNLLAQAEGQSAFQLEKVSELEYKFEVAKIKVVFTKDAKGNFLQFTLYQNGQELVFDKVE